MNHGGSISTGNTVQYTMQEKEVLYVTLSCKLTTSVGVDMDDIKKHMTKFFLQSRNTWIQLNRE
jgi:hypothetical protein